MPVSEHHIREAVARCVLGDVPLKDFIEWFAPRAWEILDDRTPAGQMAAEIELLLAEHSAGDLSQERLREALRRFAVGHSVIDTTVAWATVAAGLASSVGWVTHTLGTGTSTTFDLRQNAESPRIMVEVEHAA